jgi:hypothetical protein
LPNRHRIALLVASALSTASARAVDLPRDADRALPCRPTVSCTADLAPPGTLEAELGAFYSRLGGGGRLWAYPFLLKQTFTHLLQLQVGSNGYTVVHGVPALRHVDNLVVGPKLHLVDQGWALPSLAITAQASLPVFASGHDGAFLTAHASKDVGPLHVDGNAGAYVWWGEGDAAPQAFAAVALSASPLAPFGVALEGYVYSDAQPYSGRDGGLRAAITTTPRSWLVFDFGGDVGFYPLSRALSLFVGMTVVPVTFFHTAN